MRRRGFLAGATALALPGVIRASAPTPSGAVGLVCSPAGIAGILSEGEDGALLDPSFRWHLGSNTKAMTAALYARMVDQRRCRWGASVASLFPSIRSHPAWADLHVEDLLSHAAGLTDGFVDGAWLDARRADAATVTKQRLALVERVLALPPPERSGVYRYGNLNYVLVGAAIEQATGRTWEQVMSAELFAPLRIGEAGFGAPPRAGPWGRSADEHGLRSIDPLGAADNPAVLWPSGGVHITTSVYAQFLSLFLRAGTPLLRRETLAHLLTPARPDLRYAGGWSLEGRASAPTDTLTHDGSNTLWFATAIVERTSGHGYAAMANCGGQRGIATTDRLLQRLRKRPALA